ncbi:hypothetical protein GDO86_014087 [Hymenochirus boettgeri]|uniref:Uncharacterized protein n=1 Tax=Hymenochirus boettgeri TaxID=247094 RepID=A0A8T2JVW5_9PIPI|nr:hypothetical protein GDO86_014087 [Hymenochirus boettgeri]
MSSKTALPGKGGLERIPMLLAECRVQVLSYGKCVSASTSGRNELRRGACAKEFEDLKQCMMTAKRRMR